MLLGKNNHSLDAKGRLIVPAKFREELGQVFVIAKAFDDRYINIYPLSTWNKLKEKLEGMSAFNKNAIRFRRFLFSDAYECESDPQGRFMIPSDLRDYAGIIKEVVSIGADDHIEIWAKEGWQAYSENDNIINGDTLEEISKLGF